VSRFSELLDDFFYRPDENVSGLLEFAAGSDEMLPVTPEEAPQEYLAFMPELPRSEPHLLGVMNLRGDVIPVYDIKLRLRLTEQPAKVAGPDVPPPPRQARIIVAHTEEGPAGLWVDSVKEVVRLKPSMVESATPGVGGERDCVAGIGRRGSLLYILLDVQQALA
jgi:purine-binding chemotaxis protein CheW